jgi:catechol-2,3-dioxygenase
MFVKRISSMRTSLPEDQTLFLAYIEVITAACSALPSTVFSWVKNHMKCAGVDIKKYKAHSLRSASSAFAAQSGNTIGSIKQHTHWSHRSNTFKQFYLKPFNSHMESSRITSSIFSSPENPYHHIGV